jgi:hypothetical protein
MTCVAVTAVGVDHERFAEADLVLGSVEELDHRIWAGTGTTPTPVERTGTG